MTMTEQLYNQQQNPLASIGNIYGQTGQTGFGGYASSPVGAIGQSGVNPYVNDPYTSALVQQHLGSQAGWGTQINRSPYNIDPLTAIALQQQQLHALQQQQLQQQLLGTTSGIGQQFGGNVGNLGRTPYNIDPLTALTLQQQMHSQNLGMGVGQQQYGSQWGNTGMLGRTNIDPLTALAIQQQQLQQLQQQVLQQQLIHQQLLQQLTSGVGTGMGSGLQSQVGSQSPYGNVWGSQFGSTPQTQLGTQFGVNPLSQQTLFGQGVNPYGSLTGNVGNNPMTQFGTNPFTQGSVGLHPSIARTLSGGLNPQQFSSPWNTGQNLSGVQQQLGSQFGQQINPYGTQFGQQVHPSLTGLSNLGQSTHGFSGLQGVGSGFSQQSVNPLLNLLSSSGGFGNY